MKPTAVRHPIHRGSVLAHGIVFDVQALGEAEARARLLSWAPKATLVHRCESFLVAQLPEPMRMRADASPGGPLVRYGQMLSSAPLEKDELARLDATDPSVLVVIGGAARQLSIDERTREDPASWIDVSDYEIVDDAKPLGSAGRSPEAGLSPLDIDVRASFGVAPAPPGARELARALARRAATDPDAVGAPAQNRAVSRFFQAISRLIGFFFQSAGGGAESGGADARALAVRDDDRPRRPSWLSALTRSLRTLSMRFLLWSRLARYVGRRQAEYLSRMLDMFDRGDLDDALRHAIALGGDDADELAYPALGTPSPRDKLAIAPARARATTAMFGGESLFEELRRRYRRAFAQLVKAGDIEKAAFVLAELLKADEEAVSFLEKHGRTRLAAEIAEARRLAPGLVVRQWFLAGDRARAVRWARATGAFADALHRLEASGNKQEAAGLRLVWADVLAASGDVAAAVDIVWPIEGARPLAIAWIDRAIALGGPAAARMAIRKLRLLPDAFEEIRDLTLALLREPGEDGLTNTRMIAGEIVSQPAEGPLCSLAKPVLRALLGSPEGTDAALADRVLAATNDAVLEADVRPLWSKAAPARGRGVSVSASALTRMGSSRNHNEDACLAALLAPQARHASAGAAHGDVARDGLVLGVFDGMGGWSSGNVASGVARDTVAERLRDAFSCAESEGAWGESLRGAVGAANAAIYQRATSDPRTRGCGSTAVVATVFGSTLFVAHVGDSRAYLRRNGGLSMLTKDHSLVNDYIAMGKLLTQEEIDEFPHKNIITRALGMSESVKVDLVSTELSRGDVLLLCTDGVWAILSEKDIERALTGGATPSAMCASLLQECVAQNGPDDMAIAIAFFDGKHLRATSGLPVQPVLCAPSAGHSPSRARSVTLAARQEPLVIHRAAADTGALPIHDAAELPDGRLLVALGELGAWVVSREGRALTRFSEPAHAIVISDHGDQALLVARRGESSRITRLDLARKRQEPWCDARMDTFARDFDGSIWYVACGSTLHAVDAASSGWEHLWDVSEQGSTINAIARNGATLSALFDHGRIASREAWIFDLPSHRLRARATLTLEGTLARVALSPRGVAVTQEASESLEVGAHFYQGGTRTRVPLAGLVSSVELRLTDEWLVIVGQGERGAVACVFDAASLGERARVALDGRVVRAGARVTGERLLLFDDRGRILVISLRTGSVIREMRLS